jgi:beta-lactamase regulating signal transducer with metallopeptidase domain
VIPAADMLAVNHLAPRILNALVSSTLKASTVLALVYLSTRLMKSVHPRLRHLLWLSAISSYLAILLLSLFSPVIHFGRIRVPFENAVIFDTLSYPFAPKAGVLPLSFPRGQPGSPVAHIPASHSQGFSVWSLTLLLLWLAGAFTSSLRVIVGKARLSGLIAKTAVPCPRKLGRLLGPLRSKTGIRRKVLVLVSPRCTVPFTCRTVKPVVVLPSFMKGLPVERLRAVFLHELRHVKRMDSLTQSAARAICSLFWFVPFVWAACSRLYLEQEKACDRGVIDGGVERCEYAECVLDAVRLSHGTAMFAGLFFSGGRKRILEDRIHHILKGGKTMKKGILIFVTAVLATCALIVMSGAAGKKAIPNEEAWQKFVGEWVNTEILGTLQSPQKIVIKPDYTGEDWKVTTQSSPSFEWQVEIQKCWTDGKGNKYCKFFQRYINTPSKYGFTYICLMRVDKSGAVLEANTRDAEVYSNYPEKIDPKVKRISEGTYFIYHRK